jgi:hypothetical protein
MLRTSPIHDQIFAALKQLSVDYARLQPWYPYPRLAVAELEPGKWDFTLMDQIMEDFMQATAPKPVVMNISTIPQWMFRTPEPVTYPEDPAEIYWAYEQGTELRDPSGRGLRTISSESHAGTSPGASAMSRDASTGQGITIASITGRSSTSRTTSIT